MEDEDETEGLKESEAHNLLVRQRCIQEQRKCVLVLHFCGIVNFLQKQ
jgi:hypothetical protein